MERNVKKRFGGIYQEYRAWFKERAQDSARPLAEEELIGSQTFHEDVFEDEDCVLNRMYYLVPLSPTESRSGVLEIFAFSELNLLRKDPNSALHDISDIFPAEYRRELST